MSTYTGPKYPDITVSLIGGDGNVFAVIGAVHKAMRRAGLSQAERDQFFAEATAGDYDHALRTVMAWVEVE